MTEVTKLISGFRVFKSTTFNQKKEVIKHLLIQGQKPSTMVISCVDIRISPAEIFATNPGELYVINNIGGIVPKFDTKGIHGILAAIEYAVKEIQVQNIIVLGHAKCDSIKMMMSEKTSESHGNLSESMKIWLSIAAEARDAVRAQLADKTEEEQQKACEQESLVISMRNLMTYPYILERMKQRKLNIFGWHFDIENAEITAFDPNTRFFEPIA